MQRRLFRNAHTLISRTSALPTQFHVIAPRYRGKKKVLDVPGQLLTMSTPPEQPDSSGEDYDDDAPTDGQWQSQVPGDDEVPPSPAWLGGAAPPGGPQTKAAHPMQKRRRVTRACDECRRKKIKCDGKQPCTHCTVYSYGQYGLMERECCFIPHKAHILSPADNICL